MEHKKAEQYRSPHYAVTLRLKPSLGLLLEDLSERMGISKTAVIAVALRDLGKREGIQERTPKEGKASDDND